MDVLVTGASRGIGLQLVREYAARGDRVFACCRRPGSAALPPGAHAVALDVADERSIEAAHAAVAHETDGLDVLVNNAGILDARHGPERRDSIQRLGELTFDDLMAVLRVNSVAPVMVAQRFAPLLRRGAKLVNVSSDAASLEDKTTGGWYAYCASKAALNMMTRALAGDLGPAGVTVVSLHPGWVRTDMGGDGADVPVEEAAAAIVATVDALGPDRNGAYMDRDGTPRRW